MKAIIDLLTKLLSSGSGVSMMRGMSAVSLLVGCAIAFIGLYMRLDLLSLSALCAVFVGAAFTGKVAQKKVESDKPQE